MNPSAKKSGNLFGLSALTEHVFYSSVDEVVDDPRMNGQAHYVRRAFAEMKLDGILCIDGKPTVYLRDFRQPITRDEANELHKKFWNQGAGTLLVIQDPAYVYIFSGMVEPSNGQGDLDEHAALIEKLNRVADTLEAHRFVERVASGHYYRTHLSSFNAKNAVDQYLLDNLGVVSECLCHQDSRQERKRVHALLGRIIFSCYLIDREIIFLQDYSFIRNQQIRMLVDLLREYSPAKAKNLLYELFSRLRTDFNGSMFDEDLDKEKQSITDEDLDNLRRFLEGEELRSGQRTLGFWAYDFSVIPVETISAIYEKFLEEEDAKDKEAKGAFYTPKHLAEMVVEEAVSSFDTLLDKKYLDPACGSGIFLVILFNRLAEEWARRNPRAQQRTKAKELLAILEGHLCGVDINATACAIACFSLYIAFLDQFEPPTLREFQDKTKKLLPKLLAYRNDKYQNTTTPAIYEGNFFDEELPIVNDFDVVLGNPPWVGRNQPGDAQVKEWLFGDCNPYLSLAPKEKAKRTAIFLPQKQTAHAFMWKASCHVNEKGVGVLLLPTKVLLNKTDAFQSKWFSNVCVTRILQLADFSFVLFPEADCPSCIVRFSNQSFDSNNHKIEYAVPKVRRQDPRSGLIPVFPEDRKWISLHELLEEAKQSRAAVLWKTHLWGTPRDVAFLNYLLRLDNLNKVAGEPAENKRWIKGQGFQPWYQISYDENPSIYGKPKAIPGELSDPFLKTVDDNLYMFVVQDDCISLRERLEAIRCKGKPRNTPIEKLKASLKGFRRSPDKRLFQPPLVLVNNGFTKFTFVDFHVFYQHSLTGITSVSSEDEDLLRFFTIYVKSRLASYFLFHTASSWGTERDRVLVHELMGLPFPLPESPHTSSHAGKIVTNVASKMRSLQQEITNLYAKAKKKDNYELQVETIDEFRKRRVEALQVELEPLIYEYFDLTPEEIALVEDTYQIYEPSSTPSSPDSSIPTLRETKPEDRQAYSELLCEMLNDWSRLDQPNKRKQPFYFNAETYVMSEIGMVLVSINKSKSKSAHSKAASNGQLQAACKRVAKASSTNQHPFEFLRGIIFGDNANETILILKPDLLGQWTRTSALNDADTIFNAIIQAKRTSK